MSDDLRRTVLRILDWPKPKSIRDQHRITNEYAAAVFVDYGNATDSRRDFDPVAGYGVGLRWRTPIGPVNLDVAYGQAVSRYRVHFSIGYTF